MITRGWGRERGVIANEDGVSFWGDGDVLELDRGADWASQVALVIKNLSANAGDVGSIPGSGRSPGGGYGNPLQYSCLENPVDRGAWRAWSMGVTTSWTQLK